MKRQTFNLFDLILLISVGTFLLSCVFTSLQTARTKEPGQAEISAGYMQLRSIDEFSEDPVQLIGINARVGVADNFDAGIAHSFDITKDTENMGNTLWGDVKYQFSNKANENQKLTFSSGLIKGYIYDSDVQGHITSLPMYFSVPVNNRFTPTLLYRYRLVSEGFFPDSDSFDESSHLFAVGLEYYLKEPDPTKWVPKLALSIGTLQRFDGNSEDSGSFLVNFGLKIESPFGNK
ncbi:MAG TPA: hypothetical protein VEP89_11760 [Draconibacterium sp.]|nr:hypothetical protein [Draconibacterium sp.]